MAVGLVTDWVDPVFAKLLNQQFTKNPRRGDEGFGLAAQNANRTRNVNASTTGIDLPTVTAKFRADYDLVNRARNVECGVQSDG